MRQLRFPRKNSQARTVLDALLNKEHLTAWDGIERWAMLRLPNHISVLEKKFGIKIERKTHVKKAANGKLIHWNEYWMSDEEIKRVKNLMESRNVS